MKNLRGGFLLGAMAFHLGIFLQEAQAQFSWHDVHQPCRSIRFLNNSFFVVGDTIATSEDGEVFIDRTGPEIQGYGIASDGRRYVAIGKPNPFNHEFWRSADGISWTKSTALSGMYKAIAAGNGVFIATGERYIRSLDGGATWTPELGPPLPKNLIFAPVGFLAATGVGLYRTTHGTAWQEISLDTGGRSAEGSRDVRAIAHVNGLYLAATSHSIYLSPNAEQWSSRPYPAGLSLPVIDFAYGNGAFVGITGTNQVCISTDNAHTWQLVANLPEPLRTISFGKGKFLAGNERGVIFRSENGRDWRAIRTPAGPGYFDIVYADDRFIAVPTNTPENYSSTDGMAWKAIPGVSGMRRIAYREGQFIAITIRGVLSSSNGEHWTTVTNFTEETLSDVTLGPLGGVAVGRSIYHSTDLTNWVQRTGKEEAFYAVTWAEGRYVAAGPTSVAVSTNGENWTRATAPIIPSDVVGSPKGFVMVGGLGGIAYSPDGFTWVKVTPMAGSLYGVTYGGDVFVAVGSSGAILISSNGKDWRSQSLAVGNNNFTAVAFGEDRFVAAGMRFTSLTAVSVMPQLRIARENSSIHLQFPASDDPLSIEMTHDFSGWTTLTNVGRATLGGEITVRTADKRFFRLKQ